MFQKPTREALCDAATWPNLITIGRLAVSPIIAYKFYKEPKELAKLAGLVELSDNIDGSLARLGRKFPELQKYGFRESKLGAKADPFTDKIYMAEMQTAALLNNVLDKPHLKLLGIASLAQKTHVSIQTFRHEQQGIELPVRPMGRIYEFISNAGFGTIALAEQISDETTRNRVKNVGAMIATVGVVGAAIGTFQYAHDARNYTPQHSEQLASPVATELV